MITMMMTGKLIQDPQHRVSSNSKSYCTALLSTPADDGNYTLVSCIAFNQPAVEKLLTHTKDDTVTVLGTGKLSSWEKGGKQHHGLSIVVDKLLTPYELSVKKRAIKETEAA